MQRYRKLQIAKSKLTTELDLIEFVDKARQMHFLKRVSMNVRQRASLSYFRRYTIKGEDFQRLVVNAARKSYVKTSRVAAERVVEECIPDEDMIDRRIVYEMTGRRLDHNDFRDESSDEVEAGGDIVISDVDPSLDIDTAFGYGTMTINYD